MATKPLVLAAPAWRIGIAVEGRPYEYCVDAYFIKHVTKPFRRILLVYPARACTPTPSPEAVRLEGGVADTVTLLSLLRDGCSTAWTVSKRPRRTSLIRFILAPHPDDLERAEARSARELCTSVFGELEDGYTRATLYSESREYIEYRVGDTGSLYWRRLSGLARIDHGIATELERILSGASYA